MQLLREDAVFEMPPEVTWFTGRELIGRFLRARVLTEPGRFQMTPVAANGQPALGVYLRDDDGVYRAHSISVLTIAASRVARSHVVQRPGSVRDVRPVAGRPRCRFPGAGPMTPPVPAEWPVEAARLLEPSISYALGAVLAVKPELMPCPTPCRDWDLRMLLRHACESLAALGEGTETGRVGLDPAEDGDLAADPARAFHDRAYQLLDAWTSPGRQRQVIEEIMPEAARWQPASWPPRQPSRSPSTDGTYPGRAGSAGRSRAPWPPACWQ